jgi:catechol 2,3-dioxygenase
MAKPKRIGHLVINVKDVDASTKFYTEVLGFEIALERPGFGTFLTCGSIHHDLALFQAPEGASEVTEGGLGLNHMAIQVEDFAELTDYYNKLQQYFEKSDLRTTDHSMTRSIYIKDPDGNGIELSYEMPASEWGHDESKYMIGGTQHGRMPGPWDADIARAAAKT